MATISFLNKNFPFCIWASKEQMTDQLFEDAELTYDELKNRIEAITADLPTLSALYWRVKKWKVSGVLQWYETSTGDPPVPVIESIPYEFFFERDKDPESEENTTTERDLVCLINPYEEELDPKFWEIIQFRRIGDPIEVVTSFGIGYWGPLLNVPFLNVALPQTNRPIIKQEEDYSCSLGLSLNYEEGLEPDADVYTGGNIDITDTEDESNATVPITFLGQTFDIKVFRNLGSTMAIDAEEYWEYDPNDGGGPIYDKTTGEKLRDFP